LVDSVELSSSRRCSVAWVASGSGLLPLCKGGGAEISLSLFTGAVGANSTSSLLGGPAMSLSLLHGWPINGAHDEGGPPRCGLAFSTGAITMGLLRPDVSCRIMYQPVSIQGIRMCYKAASTTIMVMLLTLPMLRLFVQFRSIGNARNITMMVVEAVL
jgi:hypothetical protein